MAVNPLINFPQTVFGPSTNPGQGFGPPVLDWGSLLGGPGKDNSNNSNTPPSQPNKHPPPDPQQPPPQKGGVIGDLIRSGSALVQGAPLSSAEEYLYGGTAAGAKPVSVNGGVYPMYAKGGRPRVGRPAIVGERGREVFVPDRAERRPGAKNPKPMMDKKLLHQVRLAMKRGLISEKAAMHILAASPGRE